MKSRGPLITLLAGLALAGVLVTLSMNAARRVDLASGPVKNAPVATPAPVEGGAGEPADVAPGQPSDPPADQQPGATAPAGDNTGAGAAGDGGSDQRDGEAPAAPAGNKQTTWTGTVDGGKATVAVTAKGDQAIAYVCDGSRIEAWLSGTLKNGKLNLTTNGSSAHEAKLTATIAGTRVKGTVTVDGRRFAFDLATAKKPSGLYRASADVRGAKLVGGWIVLADGRQVGLATFAGSTTTVGPLELPAGTVTVYGTPITARPAIPGAAS